MTQPTRQHRHPRPHQFVPDPDVPPDVKGRGACSSPHGWVVSHA